ncbi:MAG: hypothetical protein QXO32_03340 [Candidatus Bathyarchaeia archaeon]
MREEKSILREMARMIRRLEEEKGSEYCTRCGNIISEEDAYCDRCGEQVERTVNKPSIKIRKIMMMER